jgi:hypothetical protein
LALVAPRLALVPAFGDNLVLAAELGSLFAREAPFAFGFALLAVIFHPFVLRTSNKMILESRDEKAGR